MDYTKQHRPLPLVLVDNAPKGPTGQMLKTALISHFGGDPAEYQLQALTLNDAANSIGTLPTQASAAFVTISEMTSFAQQDRSQNPRFPRRALEFAQLIAKSRLPVYLLRQVGISDFTGTDATAAMLAGIAGIVDDRLLLEDGALGSILCHKHLKRRDRTMLLIGDAAFRLSNLRQLISNWQQDADGNEQLDLNCFRVAAALSQIDRLRPLRGPNKQPFSFQNLALALNLQASTTSFQLNINDLRKALSVLAHRLLGPHHENFERLTLPDYARKMGFPPNLPVIAGIPQKDIAKRLYNALLVLTIHPDKNWSPPAFIAQLPHSQFSHLKIQTTRRNK